MNKSLKLLHNKNPSLSIIVTSFNRATSLQSCLQHIKESTYNNYELIIVDDGSNDASISVAKQFTKNVILLSKNGGHAAARLKGFEKARGDIFINIDSDILVRSDSLEIISNFFVKNKKVDAVTGLLSKEHPNTNFASIYKNLYMNYQFSLLQETVTFLYGSIYAIRKSAFKNIQHKQAKIADDTEKGQELILDNKNIALLKNLDVVHLKKYTIMSLIKNDFVIPYEWAKIFLKYQGWLQLCKKGTGYAHASKEQLISLILIPTILLSFFLSFFYTMNNNFLIVLCILWSFINTKFFIFLWKEKGAFFGLKSIVYTFIDHAVMAAGVFVGILSFLNES